MKKRIYLAGSGGMLGEAFYRVFKENYDLKCTDKDVNTDWLSFLDFRDYEAYRKDVTDFKPDYLFHLGAYTDLEFCEKNVDDTYMTNTIAVENAVHIANELNAHIYPNAWKVVPVSVSRVIGKVRIMMEKGPNIDHPIGIASEPVAPGDVLYASQDAGLRR